MLRRTKGRLLLTLLVITGLAGTLNDLTLSNKERKFAVNEFKESRANLLKAVKGLSTTQLNFRTAPERWSVEQCFFHITLAEKQLWEMFEQNMKGPATPEKRTEVKFTDQQIINMITDRSKKATAPEPLRPEKAPWKNLDEAMIAYKEARAMHLKYAKTSTEDLRNHIFQLPFGSIDGYQFLLFMSAHSRRHTLQIEEVEADPSFPK
jgi:hypothetical protein